MKLPWQSSMCQCYKDGGKVLNCYVWKCQGIKRRFRKPKHMKEHIKKDSIRNLSKNSENYELKPKFKMKSIIWQIVNFSFQQTKTLCQNNLNITFFFTFFKGYRYNNKHQRLYLLGAPENKCQISFSSQSSLAISYVTSPIKLVGKIRQGRLALSHSVPSLLW